MLVKKTLASSCFGLLGALFVAFPTHAIASDKSILDSLVQQAASKDIPTSQQAVIKLREFKDAGVEAFWKAINKIYRIIRNYAQLWMQSVSKKIVMHRVCTGIKI